MALVPSSSARGEPAGLPGATAATRYAGATAAGAPVAGTFAVGDFVVDQSGKLWVCTVAGTPGTWVQVGGAGGPTLLFESTVAGVDAASIDTGAGGIAGGFRILEVHLVCRTDAAGANDVVDVTFNNDATAIYDRKSTAGGVAVADTKLPLTVHGSGGDASTVGYGYVRVPDYAGTTWRKAGRFETNVPDSTVGNNSALGGEFGYRSTAAISQLKVAAEGAAKMKVGSHLMIYGIS